MAKKQEYCSIKWIDKNTAIRVTREVNLRAEILDNGTRIIVSGTADLEHHLIEDTTILLKKMAEEKCGEGHG